MPVIRNLMEGFGREGSLEGIRMSGCLHLTTETANLARVLVCQVVLTLSSVPATHGVRRMM